MIPCKRKREMLAMTGRVFGTKTMLRRIAHEAKLRYTGVQTHHPNPGFPSQREWVADALSADGPTTWLIWFDGGRYDWFDKLVGDYFDGELARVWNGGIGYTGDWAVRHLSGQYPDMGLFSMAQLRQADAVDYDGRDHFKIAPYMDMPDGSDMKERLAALGYRELERENPVQIEPRETNKIVRKYMADIDGAVVRYLKPHPPFEGLEEMTAGRSKVYDTLAALDSGDLTLDDLEDAYVETYRLAFEAATELVADLPDGDRVILTADHGECLRCGQLFHSRRHRPHDHLCATPWYEVER